MSKKTQKSYIDYGFGFPIRILNAPFKKMRGEWVLDINFEKYKKIILFVLVEKPYRLTGNEVKFIRYYFEMDLKSFGKRFGDVSHSAVVKWEKCGDKYTNMNWSTEKDIRLAIIDKLKPKILPKVYSQLRKVVPRKAHRIELDSANLKIA